MASEKRKRGRPSVKVLGGTLLPEGALGPNPNHPLASAMARRAVMAKVLSGLLMPTTTEKGDTLPEEAEHDERDELASA